MSLKENIFVVFIKTFSQKPSQNHWYKKIFYKNLMGVFFCEKVLMKPQKGSLSETQWKPSETLYENLIFNSAGYRGAAKGMSDHYLVEGRVRVAEVETD